jgi:hypothetical protein
LSYSVNARSWGTQTSTAASPSVLAYRKQVSSTDRFEYNTELHDSSPIITRARRALKDYAEATSSVEAKKMESRLIGLLKSIATRSSVYPSIAGTEDGVIGLHWISGHLSIEIELEPDGGYYYAAISAGKIVESGEGDGAIPTNGLQKWLASLTRYTEAKNPAWRKYFV